MLHRPGHADRIVGSSNRGIHQHAVTTKFHGDGRIGSGADTGIDDDGDFRLFDDQANIDRVLNAEPEPIGAPSGMMATAPASSTRLQRIGSSEQ